MISEEQGLRTSMEDRHFILPLDRGFLAAVFDGHRGHQTANKAAALFASNFQRFLKKANNNVGKAFKELFKSASEEIAKSPHNDEGSTAVICFIDRDTHAVYTATLGDSSANIYRKVEEDSICIPVSCTRDWSHEEDAKRAADYLKDPEIATNWTNTEEFIDRRVNSLNVSRAFGDKNTPPVSDEPVISINMLQPNDVLIISSDGLTNYMSPSMVAETVFESLEKRRDIAEDLVCDALDDFESKDNVTVIAISVH